jgi:hypothetical protein
VPPWYVASPTSQSHNLEACKTPSKCFANAGQIKTARDLSTFIRDLQELWLFGGLDTLAEKEDEEATRAKAVQVAEMIEALAGSRSVGGKKENRADEELKKEG